MKNIWFIARKDLQYVLREWSALLWLFVMPIVFFYFIGTAMTGFSVTSGSQTQLAVSVPMDAGFLADEVIRRLEQNDFEVTRPANDADFRNATPRLAFPPNFTADVLQGTQAALELTHGESGLTKDYDEMRAKRASFTVLADLAAAEKDGRAPTPESLAALDELPRGLSLDVTPAGGRVETPMGLDQSIPGMMVMFTLIVLLTAGASALVQERNEGLLQRLASTPISRGELVTGKWLGKLILGSVQIIFAMLVGTLLFQFDWGPGLPMILLVMLGWGALCASLGLLLGCIVRTEAQATGIGVLTSCVFAALGGCWWPIEITPDWAQKLQMLVPPGWAMDALHKLVSFRADAVTVIPHVAVLFAAAWVVGLLAARRFRYA
jgi:ABC-type Na+ efflux pump permease subunit